VTKKPFFYFEKHTDNKLFKKNMRRVSTEPKGKQTPTNAAGAALPHKYDLANPTQTPWLCLVPHF